MKWLWNRFRCANPIILGRFFIFPSGVGASLSYLHRRLSCSPGQYHLAAPLARSRAFGRKLLVLAIHKVFLYICSARDISFIFCPRPIDVSWYWRVCVLSFWGSKASSEASLVARRGDRSRTTIMTLCKQQLLQEKPWTKVVYYMWGKPIQPVAYISASHWCF